MRKRFLQFFFMAAVLMLAGSCSEDSQAVKNIYDNWWPIHATGSEENTYFKANWNGDLNGQGAIVITFVDKSDPNIKYNESRYYKALAFNKDRKHFNYIDISTFEYTASKQLLFYVKDGKIFFEKANDAGRGTGQYEEGKDISFPDKDHMMIDGVTYERFSVYYEKHRPYGDKEKAILTEIPIAVYE